MHPILIVDDEKDNLEALQRLLRGQYDVTTTTSSFEALKLLQKKTFNVIVSDQRMPEMPGVELLEKAKQIAPSATRILLTGYTDIESVINAINRGNIYRYVAKPWDPEDLRLTLRQANEASLLRQELERKNKELASNNLELTSALARLEGLDQAKATFLSLVSHELNTPLTVLNAFAALLVERQGVLPDDLKKTVGAISGASDRFSEIIGEILAYTRLQTDAKITPADFDFKKEWAVCAETLKEELSRKKVKLDVKVATGVVAKADTEKMRLVLTRAVRECLRNCPQNSTLLVEASKSGDGVLCKLSRPGSPLSADALTPLAPEGNVLHHQKNLGLGLAMCRLIIEAHGGTLKVEAPSGGGASLSFTL